MTSAVFPTSTAGEKPALLPPFCSSPAGQDGRTEGRTTRSLSRSFVGGSPWVKFSMLAIFFL
jgi:hypothetical protein